jgi:hypothetical protein
MRKLLLSLMILFALIALPVGAQNETEIVSTAEVVVNPPSEYSSSNGATGTDILTQGIFEGGSKSSSLYLSSEEYALPDQSFAYEDISEKETVNSLDSLSDSLGPEPSTDGPYNDTEAEGIDNINSSEQPYNPGLPFSKELIETVNVLDQSEAVVLADADVPTGGQTPAPQNSNRPSSGGRNANAALSSKTLANNPGELMKFFEQSDLNPNKNGKNNITLGDSISFTESLTQSNSITNSLLDKMEQFWNGPVESAEIGDQSSTSAVYSSPASKENKSRDSRDPYLDTLSSLDMMERLASSTSVTNQNMSEALLEMESQIDILQNPGPKGSGTTLLPYLRLLKSSEVRIETSYLADYSIKDENDEPQNYAVVVGINQYSDRRNLRTSVNDAEEMARILRELYGYEVIILTDKTTENRPTKHNILEGALAEIKAKQNRGDVLVYFSGHGEVDDRGNFYLIPQDADTDPASYISEDELNQYIKDIKGLSIIVDTCYSGKLYNNSEIQRHYNGLQRIGKEQEPLILTSSKEDEPSNEMWNETNSVFTYYLCQAIMDEAKKGGRLPLQVSLQSCFDSVKEKTFRWSSSNFLSQTPQSSLHPKE